MENEFIQSRRINEIISVCPNSKEILEIGCDHGYVTAGLLLSGRCMKVISTDISPASINKAVLFCQKYNLLPYISFREGDGFSVLTKYDKVNCAIIAGIGGVEMINILKNGNSKIKNLVLQPLTNEKLVREWLVKNKYKIETDYMFEDKGQLYNIIVAKEGKTNIRKFNPLFYIYGKDNFLANNPEFVKYLRIEEIKIIKLFQSIGEISKSLNEKYSLITEALVECGEEPLPVDEEPLGIDEIMANSNVMKRINLINGVVEETTENEELEQSEQEILENSENEQNNNQ